MFDMFICVVLAYTMLIGCLMFITHHKQKLLKVIDWANTKKNKMFSDDNWNTTEKLQEMKEIKNEGYSALESIKFFLNDPYSTCQFLQEIVVPEFNKHARQTEKVPVNLSEKRLRRIILEKAEQYYATSDPLLEILAESFVAKTR